jgi:nucleotide-binding universal stress UspA family protein
MKTSFLIKKKFVGYLMFSQNRGVVMKILWTFNPFERNKDLYLSGKAILDNWFNKKDSIEVLYVASNAEAELATAFHIPSKERYSAYPKKLIEKELSKISFSKKNIQILFDKSLSLTSLVKNIVSYSKEKNINLIVLASNSKKKLPLAILGSFAATLVHISKCDLLIYHQKTKITSSLPLNVIYAHDLSRKGELGLRKLLEYVKKWNAHLTVVHVPIPQFGVELHEFRRITENKINELEKRLNKEKIIFNIHTEYVIHPISEIIIELSAKSKSNIIAVTAQANKLSAMLGGSITRQILQDSFLPTLVLKV